MYIHVNGLFLVSENEQKVDIYIYIWGKKKPSIQNSDERK